MSEELKERAEKAKKSKAWVWIFLIGYVLFMAYVVTNLETIKSNPCNVCEEKTGKECVAMAKGLTTPTAMYGEQLEGLKEELKEAGIE